MSKKEVERGRLPGMRNDQLEPLANAIGQEGVGILRTAMKKSGEEGVAMEVDPERLDQALGYLAKN